MSGKRLFDYLQDQLTLYPQQRAFGHKVGTEWTYYTTAEIASLVNRLSAGLLELGLKPGDKVATVVYKASPEWMVVDFAMMQIGVWNIPMYPSISPREYHYILQESEAKFCIVGEGDLYKKVSQAAQTLPGLQGIYSFDEQPNCKPWTSLLAPEGCDLTAVNRIADAIKPDDVCTIIYTSGTTGNPKGVVLTHRNIAFNAEAIGNLVPLKPGERVLSFLPVSHIFERAAVYFYTLQGVSVSFTGTDNLGGEDGDLKAIKPHFFTTVPRLLEKVYDRIYAKGLELKGLKRALFFWALKLTDDWDFDKKFTGLDALRWKIADKLIFSKWREALGGEVRGIVTGASACPVKIMRVFNAAGIVVREGYGMTEAAPAISFSRMEPYTAMLGTVGMLLDGVEVRIDQGADYRPGEGEILCKSPGVMVEYYKQPEQTAEMIREINGERWLATGDVGTLVKNEKGNVFLKITDRKKELLKTSGGKYIAPTPIEALLKEHRLVEQVMIVGENLKFVSALIVPSVDGLKEYCLTANISFDSLEAVVRDPRVMDGYQKVVDRVNPNFSHIEQVKKFTILPTAWEPVKADGSDAELTPTLKLKRRVIMAKFKREIDEMYGD